jgi:hypothetical protein
VLCVRASMPKLLTSLGKRMEFSDGLLIYISSSDSYFSSNSYLGMAFSLRRLTFSFESAHPELSFSQPIPRCLLRRCSILICQR